MKKYYILAMCILCAICGCREISVTTTVNTDGSLERVVTTGDSSGVANSVYPIPTDSSWTITYHETKDDSDNVEKKYKAVKTFKNIAELNKYLECKGDTIPRMGIKVDLNKKFRWFYTFFEYTETYKSFNQFHKLPPADFFTVEEIELIKAGIDSGSIEDRLEEWQGHSIFEEFYQPFLEYVEKLGDSQLTPESVRSHREEMLKIVDEEEPADVEDFLKKLETILAAPSVWKLENEIKTMYDDISKKIDYMGNFYTIDFTNTVQMPGLLIDTNAPTVEGNKVTWNFESVRFYVYDFEMKAVSRVVNKWTFLVTVVISMGVLLLLILSIVRKKG
ncbi:hypothetical protein JW935_23590 [candidate division KSB1 bacterium]|nr:hypothetical protein [candidate division KSB1 bacterium]